MPNVGPMELVIVLVIALIVLGPKRLPEVGRSVGRGMREFKESISGENAHDEDDVFYVIEGTMSVMIGDRWVDAPAGSFILVPGGTTHDFENRSDARAGVLNVSAPGGFEPHMPGISDWFHANPPGAPGG